MCVCMYVCKYNMYVYRDELSQRCLFYVNKGPQTFSNLRGHESFLFDVVVKSVTFSLHWVESGPAWEKFEFLVIVIRPCV